MPTVVSGHIGNYLAGFRFFDDGSLRHLQHDIFRILAVASALTALLSIFCGIFLPVPVILQSIQPLIHFKDDIAASSAIAAVRPAVWHIEFPAETDVSVTAFS